MGLCPGVSECVCLCVCVCVCVRARACIGLGSGASVSVGACWFGHVYECGSEVWFGTLPSHAPLLTTNIPLSS